MPARNSQVRVPKQLRVVMGVQIDKARHHHMPFGIQRLGALVGLNAANLRNLAVFDTNIASVTRQSRPIDNHSIFDHEIIFRHSAPP